MNQATLQVYKAIKKEGTQKSTIGAMQTRDELYDYLNYHSYERNSMSSLPANAPKPKKSVALSGVPAGNTALCTVGRTGNDLHYRGYDILDFADQPNLRKSLTCSFMKSCRIKKNFQITKRSLERCVDSHRR
jgi:23S rRNA G2445 N2-methylase RlmL